MPNITRSYSKASILIMALHRVENRTARLKELKEAAPAKKQEISDRSNKEIDNYIAANTTKNWWGKVIAPSREEAYKRTKTDVAREHNRIDNDIVSVGEHVKFATDIMLKCKTISGSTIDLTDEQFEVLSRSFPKDKL